MRSVEAHLAQLLSLVAPLEAFPIGLVESRGCVLSEDVYAAWPLPLVDTAAVDGYAVMVADVAGAEFGETRLRVADTVAVGGTPGRAVVRGHAVKVQAGAPLPELTEAVVPAEFTDGGLDYVQVRKSAVLGQFLRRAGEDLPEGALVAPKGTVMDPRLIGLVSAVGRNAVAAHPHPRVVIITVGNDLLEPNEVMQRGKTADSNSPMLAAAVTAAGGTAYRVGPLPEVDDAIAQVIEDQLVRADLIIITGGNSASAYDSVQRVLTRLGKCEFVRVAMQPGSAQGFGVVGEEQVPVLILPGAPLAAFVSFEVFVKPVLMRMLGHQQVETELITAVAANSFTPQTDRRNYVRATLSGSEAGRPLVQALGSVGAYSHGTLARIDCLIVVPEAVVEVQAGDLLDVLQLSQPQSR